MAPSVHCSVMLAVDGTRAQILWGSRSVLEDLAYQEHCPMQQRRNVAYIFVVRMRSLVGSSMKWSEQGAHGWCRS